MNTVSNPTLTSPSAMPGRSSALLVLILSSFFLLYKYVLQVSPSVMTQELMQAFHLNGAELGFLAAGFFYAYMFVQLAAGPLLDQFNPRYITAMALLCCAAGAILFSVSQSFMVAFVARALMGAGAAFATVSYLKLTAFYFSAKKYAFVSGFLTFPVMLGALMGQTPLAYFVDKFGWQHSLYVTGLCGIVLALCFALLIKSPKMDAATKAPKLAEYWQLLKSKRNWLLTFYSGLAFCPLAVFGGLWGDPFLQAAYHVDKTHAAELVSMVFLGLGLGGTFLGWLATRIDERFTIMTSGLLLSLVCLTLVVYWNVENLWYVASLLFGFGFGTGAFMLGFVLGKECNPLPLAATVIALINSGDALLGAVTEPAVGRLLDVFPHTSAGFSLHAYHWAFSILPLFLLLAFVLLRKVAGEMKT